MLTNLFSLFDPSLSMFSFSWLIFFFVLFFLPFMFWKMNLVFSLFGLLVSFFNVEVNYSLNTTAKGVAVFVTSIFFFVFFLNFLALFPFVFSTTSHLLVTLPLSYCFWLMVIIFSWVKSFSFFLSHLVPSGTPVGLMSFMVLVELLSNFIRPLALTFRLSANMMAGHLLMSLVGGLLVSLPFFFTIGGALFQFLLVLMELGVSLIQSYVFTVLLLLYLSES